ncbi:hypothetical protein COHA_004574 [Chlorella ohadii]|uniref:UBC core domain-containing protein n=1 Tax=Chlorella ohadii TaxID=2649997 RepID=A0AAD5DQ59_9CHLO|nr:hypothetical protein COHA_004574 [Chlorella ohadii]
MGLEAALRASAEAINELRESLDEQCLSEITVEGTEGGALARFAVRPEEGGETSFTATFIGSSMPAPCVLAVAGGSDEEMAEAGSRGGDSDEDGDDDELLREWSKRLVKVEKIERGIEEREAEAEAEGNLDALQQRQIFDSRAAFRRLANELEEIFKAQDFNMVVEAADEPDGLYRWHVTLGGFDPESPLGKDMREAGRRFGSSSVQLQLVFKRPLHPFYPPSVQLSSPRFQGPILSAVASHPVFSVKGWDPTRSAREALLLLKAFLEEHARVDFSSERNTSSSAAYLPVEVLLAKLEALTGTEAAAQSMQQYQEMYRMREEQAASGSSGAATAAQQQPASKKQKSTAAAWKSGVGYGHRGVDGSAVWDAKKAEAVQAARDRELADVLDQLACDLTANLASTASAADRADCTAAVCNSCLAPYLIHQLSKASFQDMAGRWHSSDSARTIASSVAGLEAQVTHFVRVYNQAHTGAASAAGSSGAEAAEDKQEIELANYLLSVASKVSEAAPAADSDAAAGAGAGAAAANGEQELSLEEQYRLTLSQYRVRILSGVSANHSFKDQARAEVMAPKLRARRVGRELASCESDLPVCASSSVFVVADETNSNLWKALITGPENTPYCGGCFLFDIYFPPDYPRVPPKVLIRTTGSGSVRFNPNLYAEGKVCLSLLGTWQGGRGESWSPDFSTVLQVLISIQSLILVDEPWYNEPGYEQHTDDSRSSAYSAALMPSTIKWAMLDHLQHTPEYFKDVIQQHFRLRGDYILENCRRWVAWCREKNQGGHARAVEQQLSALEAELRKLRQQQPAA